MKNLDFKDKKIISSNLVINLLVAAISTLTTIVSFNFFNEKIAITICYIIIIVGFISIPILYFYLAVAENKNIKSTEEKELMLEAIPCLFVFKKRIDEFTILENGDGKLKWTFELERRSEKPVFHVDFPIFCEKIKGDTSNEVSVNILEVYVDQIDCKEDAEYVPQQLNYPFGKKQEECRLAELGSVRVPVHLQEGKSKAKVTMTLYMKNIFNELREKEYIIVDIPYVTEKLELYIAAENSAVKMSPISFLDAYANNNMYNTDPDEVAAQISKCTPYNSKFSWKTTYPKLGYRYQFKFSVPENKSSTE